MSVEGVNRFNRLPYYGVVKDPENAVESESYAYQRMQQRWELIDDLLTGTAGMRIAAQKWLPQEEDEEPAKYQARLYRSVLFEAFKDTVEKIVSKPMSRPVTLNEGENLPEGLNHLEDNADLEGTTLTEFAKAVLQDAVEHGISYILPEFPSIGTNNTLDVERQALPYFAHITARSLIYFKCRTLKSGRKELSQIRIRETKTVEHGEFADRQVDVIRVIDAKPRDANGKAFGEGTVRTFQEQVDDKGHRSFEEMSSESYAYPGEGIPLVPVYTKQVGFMEAEPPLEKLAWMNLAHWQSSSDQRNILRFARIPILAILGLNDREGAGNQRKKLTLGAGAVIRDGNEKGQVFAVQPAGAAIEAGERDLKDLERRMEALGMQPFIEATGGTTATGRAIDESRSLSPVQSWIRGLEDALTEAFIRAGIWRSAEVPDDFKVNIFNEFGLTLRAEGESDLILRACVAGKVSEVTLLREFQRRGLLSDAVDIDAEVEIIEERRASMPTLPMPPPSPPPKDDDDDGDPEPDDSKQREEPVAAGA